MNVKKINRILRIFQVQYCVLMTFITATVGIYGTLVIIVVFFTELRYYLICCNFIKDWLFTIVF